MTNPTNNYFQLFGMPQSFNIDRTELDSAYRQLQQNSHPDRFVNHSSDVQRQAVLQTAQHNEAYQTLKSSVKRACLLLSLLEIDFDLATYTVTDVNLLMEQMDYREKLNTIKQLADIEKLEEFSSSLDQLIHQLQITITSLFDSLSAQADEAVLDSLKNHICELQFLNKLALNLDEVEEHLIMMQ